MRELIISRLLFLFTRNHLLDNGFILIESKIWQDFILLFRFVIMSGLIHTNASIWSSLMVEYKILYCVVLVKIFHKLLANFAKLVTTKAFFFEKKFKYLYIYMNWGKICIKNQVENKYSKSLAIVDDGHYFSRWIWVTVIAAHLANSIHNKTAYS